MFFSVFIIFLICLIAGHTWFTVLVAHFLDINNQRARAIYYGVLNFLFFSIFLANYLIRILENNITRTYYFLSNAWLGFLINFVLVFIFITLIKFIFKKVSKYHLKIIFFVISISLSLFGLYQAQTPQVTSYEIFIKDLPAAWENKVLVHLSDIHLGPVYRANSWNRLLIKVQKLNPEAVFITGDLFDGSESDFSWLNKSLGHLNPPQGIYFSYGNHDLYLGYSQVQELFQGETINILDDKLIERDGLQIIGFNYRSNVSPDWNQDLLNKLNYQADKASILLFHEPKNIALAKEMGIDLQLSGHTHNGQFFPFNFLVKLAYQGFNYGLYQDKDFSLILSRGIGTWGPPMRTSGSSEIVKIILKKK